MLILVSYDVSTQDAEGRRRLRRVARVCVNYGQRVQKSVFECRVNQAQYETLERILLAEIDLNEDNLRFYRLTEPLAQHIKEFGVFHAINFQEETLIV
jgi:CRISPR-associated protein Cas2